MPVDDLAAQHALVQGAGLRVDGRVEPIQRDAGVERREPRLEQHLAIDRLFAAEAGKVGVGAEGGARGLAVEVRQQRDDGVDVGWPQRLRGDDLVQHALVRQAAHQHQPVDRDARRRQPVFGKQRETTFVPLQRQQAQVDLRREATVQPELFPAIVLAQLRCREIQERIADRLLHLQHAFAGDDDPGHVGLDEPCGGRVPAVRGARHQEAEPGFGAGSGVAAASSLGHRVCRVDEVSA